MRPEDFSNPPTEEGKTLTQIQMEREQQMILSQGGLAGGGKLSIWLTGYAATEPFVDIDGKPLLYANVTGCQGLSGAPVVMRTSGNYINGKGKHIWSTDLLTKFLGIYSGRAHEDSNVCRVWKVTVIDELNWSEPRLL